MHIEKLREHCIAKFGVTEAFPFDEETLVFKVMGKMFALINLNKPDFVNLKCDPELAMELREQYHAVKPGWHMHKKMWNSVYFDGTIPEATILEWVDHSYDQVVLGLPKKIQKEVERNTK